MKKGFTLVELLAVIVILAIILAIAVPSITNLIENARINAYIKNEEMMIRATRNYIALNEEELPNEIGETIEITLEEIQNEELINSIESPFNNDNCNGYVLITKIADNEYAYTPHLNCIDESRGSAFDDGLILHYKFDDFQEYTKNLIPNSPINSYPKIGNTHGTYNTNQYNSNNFFSIGTIESVSNNIVTLSSVDRPIHTYDVLTPLTTGGGVNEGVNYFIKKHSNNSFSIHEYNNIQDGSLGFAVHDSINNDIRISINANNFPTMWHGRPHLPNSALVKEIIPNCFSSKGQTHECIRLHTKHKPEGSADGMAYNVRPIVEEGKMYTFSFYYRAPYEDAIGSSIRLSLWTNGNWQGTNIREVTNSTKWQRYELTVIAPNSGSTNLYFWPNKDATIDISEIQCEEKSYATPFIENKRIDKVSDYSGNNNYATLDENTPKWVDEDVIGKGAYYFNGINNYIELDLEDNNLNQTKTISVWVNAFSFNHYGGVISNWSDGGLKFFVNNQGQYVAGFRQSGGSYKNVTTPATNLNTWYHFVMVYNNGNVTIYKNGVDVASDNGDALITNNSRYRIGWNSDNSAFYNGFIDDIRIYNRVLSEDEAKLIYESEKGKVNQ